MGFLLRRMIPRRGAIRRPRQWARLSGRKSFGFAGGWCDGRYALWCEREVFGSGESAGVATSAADSGLGPSNTTWETARLLCRCPTVSSQWSGEGVGQLGGRIQFLRDVYDMTASDFEKSVRWGLSGGFFPSLNRHPKLGEGHVRHWAKDGYVRGALLIRHPMPVPNLLLLAASPFCR